MAQFGALTSTELGVRGAKPDNGPAHKPPVMGQAQCLRGGRGRCGVPPPLAAAAADRSSDSTVTVGTTHATAPILALLASNSRREMAEDVADDSVSMRFTLPLVEPAEQATAVLLPLPASVVARILHGRLRSRWRSFSPVTTEANDTRTHWIVTSAPPYPIRGTFADTRCGGSSVRLRPAPPNTATPPHAGSGSFGAVSPVVVQLRTATVLYHLACPHLALLINYSRYSVSDLFRRGRRCVGDQMR